MGIISWSEAIQRAAHGLKRVVHAHGPNAVGAIGTEPNRWEQWAVAGQAGQGQPEVIEEGAVLTVVIGIGRVVHGRFVVTRKQAHAGTDLLLQCFSPAGVCGCIKHCSLLCVG